MSDEGFLLNIDKVSLSQRASPHVLPFSLALCLALCNSADYRWGFGGMGGGCVCSYFQGPVGVGGRLEMFAGIER